MKKRTVSSRCSVTGGPQVLPPSPDLETRIAVTSPARDIDSDAAIAAPDGVTVTQWSVVTS
ncbi:hypothetical protein ABZW11_33750 [Nonomuraea sp. NPDC004580]|uniref:hypothetical protein n=1 Tax=Nonomuraea sp. NPDC004580 TaxID=3154552 RepID=UPI0033A11754